MNITKIAVVSLFLVLTGFSQVGRAIPKAAKAADLASLSWIAGAWAGVDDGVEMEEHWLPAKGNTMLGLHRDVAGNKTVSFEFLRIEATADAITYWASPKGRPATPFRLKEVSDKKAVFENPEHDFPQRIIYWLGKDGSLHAKIEGTQGGKEAAAEWIWQKVR
jgi:hypothetical protein